MKTTLLLLVGTVLALCNQTFAAEDSFDEFYCSEEVTWRSGSYDPVRCPQGDHRACYESIRETCKDNKTGQKTVRNFDRYTGVCTNSESDCR